MTLFKTVSIVMLTIFGIFGCLICLASLWASAEEKRRASKIIKNRKDFEQP